MKTIEIDDEVYEFIQKKAVAFVETPNLALRRLLGVNKRPLSKPHSLGIGNRKKPKTNLIDLVNEGFIEENQELYLRDYRGREISGYTAKVSHGNLIYDGRRYSMSELAKILLKQNGYESDSVRGPIFWFTMDGVSIRELWDKYLRTINK